MNLQTRPAASTLAPVAAAAACNRQAPVSEFRREGRTRDYGVGYGRSSGYASGRRYVSHWGNARFEFC